MRLHDNAEVLMGDLTFEGEPCTNFVKQKIRVLDEEVLDGREESSSDSSRAFQRRRWLVDSPKFVEDAVPTIAVAFETPSASQISSTSLIPESKHAHFEVWVYSSVNHSIYATDFNDPCVLSGAN